MHLAYETNILREAIRIFKNLTVSYMCVMILSHFFSHPLSPSFIPTLSSTEVFLLPNGFPLALKSVFVCDLLGLVTVAYMSMVGK